MKKKIAINIITKNNEPYLQECLESVKSLDPEYVIIFNGDVNSKEYEICKTYAPNSTFITKWNDNFAEQRNIALEKTQSDWILWIDSDESIPEKSIIKLNELFATGLKGFYHYLRLIHGTSSMNQLRLFFKQKDVKWKYSVHEKIIHQEEQIHHHDIEIVHNVSKDKKSNIRNINILEKELSNNPNDSEYNYYAAIEYHLINQQMRALVHAEKFLYHYKVNNNDTKKMYIKYLIAWIHSIYLGNYQKATESLLSLLTVNCNIAEFWCLLGDIYIRIGRFRDAEQFFRNAILMGQYRFENGWLTDLPKYKNYPEKMIEFLKDKKDLNTLSFENETKNSLIP